MKIGKYTIPSGTVAVCFLILFLMGMNVLTRGAFLEGVIYNPKEIYSAKFWHDNFWVPFCWCPSALAAGYGFEISRRAARSFTMLPLENLDNALHQIIGTHLPTQSIAKARKEFSHALRAFASLNEEMQERGREKFELFLKREATNLKSPQICQALGWEYFTTSSPRLRHSILAILVSFSNPHVADTEERRSRIQSKLQDIEAEILPDSSGHMSPAVAGQIFHLFLKRWKINERGILCFSDELLAENEREFNAGLQKQLLEEQKRIQLEEEKNKSLQQEFAERVKQIQEKEAALRQSLLALKTKEATLEKIILDDTLVGLYRKQYNARNELTQQLSTP